MTLDRVHTTVIPSVVAGTVELFCISVARLIDGVQLYCLPVCLSVRMLQLEKRLADFD